MKDRRPVQMLHRLAVAERIQLLCLLDELLHSLGICTGVLAKRPANGFVDEEFL